MAGERRTIRPDAPGLDLEIDLDEGLEDTICVACLREGRRQRAKGCPHAPEDRAAAMSAEETDQLARAAAASPRARDILFAGLRWALGLRPWWATAAGRARKRAEWERERARRDAEERRAREERE